MSRIGDAARDVGARWSQAVAHYEGAEAIEDTIRRSLRPEPVLTVSQWADRFRVLSTKLAAEAGRYRTSRAPFLRDIMDALSPTNTIRRVVFMKAAQVGATEAGNNWIGFVIHWSPAPMIGVWPTVDTAKKVSQQRIAPLIEDCPELAALISPAKQKDSGNTVLTKSFPGGILVMTGANSGVGLRSMPARYGFLDEIDAYPGDVDGEGDPIALVANRTTSFGRAAKLFLVSTPTVHGQSRIEREYEASDQRRYFVPCPHCGVLQWLRWENLKWEWGAPGDAHYLCEDEACGKRIDERFKTEMMAAGEWRATATATDPNCIGFHISGLYSPLGWLSWEDMAREWEAAQGDISKLKTFKNTRLGETWFEEGQQVAWERVHERRATWREGTLPRGVTMLFGAVDVQASPARVELHVWGFGEGAESWHIGSEAFPGHADEPKTWLPVEEALRATWRHESGADLRIDRLAVDTGDQTVAVYGWVIRQDQSRVFAVKGRDGYEINAPVASPSYITYGGKRKAVALRMICVNVFKAELYRALAMDRPTDAEIADNGFPSGFVHVPDFKDAEWCRQLVAERRVRLRSGKYQWQKEHPRNEALDCWIYCRAMLWTMGVAGWRPAKWAALRERRGLDKVAPEAPPMPKVAPVVARAAKAVVKVRRVVRASF